MRGGGVWAAVAAAVLAPLIVAGATLAPAAAQEPVVGVLPFSYLDTSGEPRDQSAEHARRLQAMTDGLAADIAAAAPVHTLTLPEAAACAGDSDCILGRARAAGAQFVVAGAVQKISTMATQMWIGVFDAETGRQLFHRNMSFRGDNDTAWRRATEFLARQIAEKGLAAG